jgi:putative FmdB family regulatory protein
MPTYGYKCEECGIVFERFQHFSEEPLKTCPECEGTVHRIIHPVGVIFKGKGFYVTDNRGGHSATAPSTAGKDNGHKAMPEKPASESAESASSNSTSSKDTDD